MNRLVLAVTVTAALGAGIGFVVGCSSDETPAEEVDAGDGTSSGNTSNSSSSSTSSSSTSSSGGDPDAGGGDGGGDGGGAGATADSIACGTATCNTNMNQSCCLLFDGGATCAQNCPQQSADLQCDDSADCNGGDKCCLGFGGGISAQCDNNCAGGPAAVQLCQTDAECGTNGPCNVKTCIQRKLKVCGNPVICN